MVGVQEQVAVSCICFSILMVFVSEGIFLQVLDFSLLPEGQESFPALGHVMFNLFIPEPRRSLEDCALGSATGVLLCPLHETGTHSCCTTLPPSPAGVSQRPEAKKLQLL